MKILQISSARTLGGGERHFADLANALVRRGHEVYAALPPRSPLREELTALPTQNIFSLRLRNALDLGSAVEMARLLREHQIEIAHAHVARDYPLAAMAMKRNRQAKLIITRHVLFPLNRLHAITLSTVSRVIAVSRATERTLLAQKIFPENKITVIPNGVDFRRLDAGLQRFTREGFRRRINIPSKSLLVGSVGELKRQKGHEDFLRAASLIARERADTHFILAGADATRKHEYHARLERLIDEFNLNGRVHLTGWVEDVAPLLAALDVYVSASHTESFGLSIVEAMAAGLAVVATETEGAREIIEIGRTGMLAPVGEAEVLARAIGSLLENPSERERLGTQARLAARERFDLDSMTTATERVYREALNESVAERE